MKKEIRFERELSTVLNDIKNPPSKKKDGLDCMCKSCVKRRERDLIKKEYREDEDAL